MKKAPLPNWDLFRETPPSLGTFIINREGENEATTIFIVKPTVEYRNSSDITGTLETTEKKSQSNKKHGQDHHKINRIT